MLFSLSFAPEILLGVRSPIGSASGGIGAFFNLPQATVNITQLDNVDENCKPIPETSGDKKKHARDSPESALDDIVGNFTRVVPRVELNMGPVAELEVGTGDFETQLATQVTVAETEFPLQTACLAYDKENKTYAAPTSVVIPPNDNKDGEDGDEGGGNGENEQGPGGKKQSLARRVDPQEVHTLLRFWIVLASLTLAVGIGLLGSGERVGYAMRKGRCSRTSFLPSSTEWESRLPVNMLG